MDRGGWGGGRNVVTGAVGGKTDKGCGVKFPFGFPGALNPYQRSLPPRSTTSPPMVSDLNPTPMRQGIMEYKDNQVFDDRRMKSNYVANYIAPTETSSVQNPNKKCSVCDRPRATVVCAACGFRKGNLRVQRQCSAHTKVQFLTDLKECPQCRTGNLMEEP